MNLSDAFAGVAGSNRNGNKGGGIGGFDTAAAAPEFSPLPPGVYEARVAKGEYCTTRAGDDAYRMKFEVTKGEQAGRTCIRMWTFGEKALPYSKRDLSVFGLTTSEKLLSPFPEPCREYLVKLVVALQKGDDGIDRNDIKRVQILSVADSPASEFVLPDDPEGEPK
ncbi:MAG: hypothetical protein U0744_04585 [Gemmataceae bacterium]